MTWSVYIHIFLEDGKARVSVTGLGGPLKGSLGFEHTESGPEENLVNHCGRSGVVLCLWVCSLPFHPLFSDPSDKVALSVVGLKRTRGKFGKVDGEVEFSRG